MNKLENETWDDYAFRNNLYKIKYSNKDALCSVIDDVIIPDHKHLTYRHHDFNWYINCIEHTISYTRPSFLEFIMYELFNLKNKYKQTNCYYDADYISSSCDYTVEQRKEDQNRQHWLLQEIVFWEKKMKENKYNYRDKTEIEKKINEQQHENIKKRFIDLKAIISETHKEQLEELIIIMKSTQIQFLEGKCKNNYVKDYRVERQKFHNDNLRAQITINKKEHIDLYHNYVNNKEIKTHFQELK